MMNQEEPQPEDLGIAVDAKDVDADAAFGVELNLEELKMVERVK